MIVQQFLEAAQPDERPESRDRPSKDGAHGAGKFSMANID